MLEARHSRGAIIADQTEDAPLEWRAPSYGLLLSNGAYFHGIAVHAGVLGVSRDTCPERAGWDRPVRLPTKQNDPPDSCGPCGRCGRSLL